MRTIITFSIPVETGNELVKSGKIGDVLGGITEDFAPEAAYFYIDDAGRRAGAFVVDLSDPLDLPKHVEALFFGLNASVSTRPAFGLEDMANLGDAIGPVVQKYG
jgi:hypothetical protein